MKKHIAVLPGDGVGSEVTAQAVAVLKAVANKFSHTFEFEEGLIGGVAIDASGNSYPPRTRKLCKSADAILFGAIGDPKYDNDPSAQVRPEQGLLAMRKDLGLYANVRPIKTFKELVDSSPLKPDIVLNVDFVVIRELIGGIYFGKKGLRNDGTYAFDTSEYSVREIRRAGEYAYDLAMRRNKRLTLVDKANVLETSRLWRKTIQSMNKKYPQVTVEYMFVDNAAMQIIKRPSSFDVIVTENMFGDILTDEASVITGSLGMLPSASIGAKTALYEPIHGSYPKAAGQNTANPIGSILSAAMMLDYSFGLKEEAEAVTRAVGEALKRRIGTKDIFPSHPSTTFDVGSFISSVI